MVRYSFLRIIHSFTFTSPAVQISQKPVISSVVSNGNGSYTLSGIGLNGVSEGASYGDDVQNNTDYPIVHLTNGAGNGYYARTYNWNLTHLTPGTTPETVQMTLSVGLPSGPYSLFVSANGVSSAAFSFTAP
jgi:hypothetical protein